MMAVFTLQSPDGRKIKIEAADEATAIRGAQEWAAANPAIAQLKGSVAPQAARPTEGSSNIEDRRPEPPKVPLDLGTATAATINGIVENGIPVIGPMARDLTDRAQAGIGALMGNDYEEGLKAIQDRRAAINEAAPIANMAGGIVGGIGTFGAAAKAPAIADALGLTGNLAARVGKSALSGGGIAAADQAVRGGDVFDAAEAGIIGAGVGGAIPAVGAAVRGAVNAGGRVLGPTINAILRPEEEALRRSGAAYARDAGTAGWGASDEVAARSAQIPVLNADRGGETVRALTRSVANQSPEARQAIVGVTEDRFAGQGQRAVQVVRDIAGGAVDDIAFQQGIRRAADAANEPAYRRAFTDPNGQVLWDARFASLMEAPAIRAAVSQAETRGANRAVIEGFKPIRNPFNIGADGSVSLRTDAKPSLQFWDQVKRNLDGMIDEAKDRTLRGDLTALKRQLVEMLDEAVPSYRQARAGAAEFFGAEDALEAGKKFGANMRLVPEAREAFGKFSAPAKAAFRTGYASTLIDRIMAASDRTNVINQTFKSPASRQMIELVFGPAKAKELEAYVRAETLADMLRGAMGNSTTARQLMEMGLGGGAGYVLSGGDLVGAGAGALATRGARAVGQRVDNRVMQMVAKLLTSDNPNAINLAVQQAMKSPAYMLAMEDLGLMLGAPARGAALAVNE